jgi:hypothetical protein
MEVIIIRNTDLFVASPADQQGAIKKARDKSPWHSVSAN